jgi:hypothetical protein
MQTKKLPREVSLDKRLEEVGKHAKKKPHKAATSFSDFFVRFLMEWKIAKAKSISS